MNLLYLSTYLRFKAFELIVKPLGLPNKHNHINYLFFQIPLYENLVQNFVNIVNDQNIFQDIVRVIESLKNLFDKLYLVDQLITDLIKSLINERKIVNVIKTQLAAKTGRQ